MRNRGKAGTAKLTNVVVAGFGERCNLVREGKMFVKDTSIAKLSLTNPRHALHHEKRQNFKTVT